MSPKLRRILNRSILLMMIVWFVGGLVLFPDAPIHPCGAGGNYLYNYHPYGYCGKQGQSRTLADLRHFQIWQDVLFLIWAPGILSLVLLRRNMPKDWW